MGVQAALEQVTHLRVKTSLALLMETRDSDLELRGRDG